MKEIYSEIIQFRGSHFDFGRLQGERLKGSKMVKNRENQWKVRMPRFSIDPAEAKSAIVSAAPYIWDELLGLQEALEWPLERVLQEFGGYRVDYARSGCSIMTGEHFLIRNYDYHPKTYEGRYTLFQPSDGGYAIIGPSQRVTGRMDGMNEKGLAVGYNFMNRKKPGDGFICCMIGRLLLESCADAEEAVYLLKEIPHRHSFTYAVYDRKGGNYLIETSPREVKVRQAAACTNHFEIMKEENRRHLADSERRLGILEKESPADAYQTFRLMNDTDRGIFSDLYSSWAGTIHTSGYFPQELKAWFALGGDREPEEIDFGRWLGGEDLSLEQMKGNVNTDLPFLHMDQPADWFK